MKIKFDTSKSEQNQLNELKETLEERENQNEFLRKQLKSLQEKLKDDDSVAKITEEKRKIEKENKILKKLVKKQSESLEDDSRIKVLQAVIESSTNELKRLFKAVLKSSSLYDSDKLSFAKKSLKNVLPLNDQLKIVADFFEESALTNVTSSTLNITESNAFSFLEKLAL